MTVHLRVLVIYLLRFVFKVIKKNTISKQNLAVLYIQWSWKVFIYGIYTVYTVKIFCKLIKTRFSYGTWTKSTYFIKMLHYVSI